MTPAEFIAKWSRSELKERASAQEHFLDLCALVGHEPPAKADPAGVFFCFEKSVGKERGGDGFADVWKRGCFGWEYKGKGKDLEAAYHQLLDYREALENPPLLVVSDIDRIVVRTNFTGTRAQTYEIPLAAMGEPRSLEILRALFFEPEKLRPGQPSRAVTQVAAEGLGALAQALRDRGLEPRRVARFVDRLVFCLFAEDVGILPAGLFGRLLEQARARPERFARLAGDLFREMATGGSFGVDPIPHVNGSLFDDAETIDLTEAELARLREISRLDWAAIDPSIFGTLFERGLDPAKRAQLGAHYTSREDIETLVEPVVMAPLRREWEATQAVVRSLLATAGKEGGPPPPAPLSPAQRRKAEEEAWIQIERFLGRLESVTVLDPACGSGNFLYVTLWRLKDLEAEVTEFVLAAGLQAPLRVGVGPWQLYGIEVNPYAHELAQLTVWIGYLQWQRAHGTSAWKEPILQAMGNIECKDAILDLADPAHPTTPTWPKAEYIVGNPPFLGTKKLRGELGDEYVEALFGLYGDRIPNFSDLCCYWFERARSEIQLGRGKRAGLLATQGIRGGLNREVLKRIKDSGDIFWAVSDREWILDGANVHVSMVGFDDGTERARILDGQPVERIQATLTATADIASARKLVANAGIGFIADVKAGRFEVPFEEAWSLLFEPNPNGRPTSDVLTPWMNAKDLVQRPEGYWIIDFGIDRGEGESALYPAPFDLVRRLVKPERDKVQREAYGRLWWLHARPGPGMRRAVAALGRFLVTPTVSKHRLFAWVEPPVLPAHLLVAFARDDDYFFGLLHSRVHEFWALAQGTQLRERESGFRYTPTTCFETFPFPYPESSLSSEIAAAARELDALRSRWLNPPEWVREEVLEFPGATDGPWARWVVEPDTRGIGTVRWPRLVPRDADCAAKLAKRTLTNLYNERPAWLDLAHRRLDELVLAAYGWPADLADDDLLARLLGLNLERAAGEG